MNPILRNLLLLAMAWAVAASAQDPQRWSCELSATHPNPKPIYEKIKKIIIPRIDFKNAPVSDAMTMLATLDAEHNWGVNFAFSPGTKSFPPPGGDRVAGDKSTEPQITLCGTSMRYLDVIDSICKQAGLFWWFDSRALVIANKEAYERSKSAKKQ